MGQLDKSAIMWGIRRNFLICGSVSDSDANKIVDLVLEITTDKVEAKRIVSLY